MWSRLTFRRKRALIVGLVLSACLGCTVWLYVTWWVPSMRLRDVAWLDSASREEMLVTAHQAIRWPGGRDHDAFIVLDHVGDPRSVPHLIRALWWQEVFEPGNTWSCTHSHCIEALRHITGVDAGSTHAQWQAWYDEVGRPMQGSP